MTIYAALLPAAVAIIAAAALVITVVRAGRDVAATAAARSKPQQPQPTWNRTSSAPPWQKGRPA